MIVAGTGSRSLAIAPIELKREVLTLTKTALEELQPTSIISGGAEGFDHCLTVAAWQMDIPFSLYIPTSSYGTYYWSQHSVTKTDRTADWQMMYFRAVTIEIVCQSLYVNGKHANFIRNDRMIADADHMLVYNPTTTGTRQAFQTIKAVGKPFTLI